MFLNFLSKCLLYYRNLNTTHPSFENLIITLKVALSLRFFYRACGLESHYALMFILDMSLNHSTDPSINLIPRAEKTESLWIDHINSCENVKILLGSIWLSMMYRAVFFTLNFLINLNNIIFHEIKVKLIYIFFI